MTEPDGNSILGLTTLVAIAAAVGSALADIAKTAISNSLDTKRTERQESRRIFEKYKNPLALSATELAHRLVEINRNYPTNFLLRKNLATKIRSLKKNSNEDHHFKKYKLVSTLYRFCAFLGWLEIYRRDTVFLSSGNFAKDQELSQCIARFRSAISDGHINQFENWKDWDDHLIFREELRAVGESMVRSASSSYQVMGYADFEKVLQDESASAHYWLSETIHFFDDPKTKDDFRRIRLCLLLIRLCDLIELLSGQPLSAWLEKGLAEARETLKQLNYTDN